MPRSIDPANSVTKKNLWNQMTGFKSIVAIEKYDNNAYIPPSAIP